MNKSINSNSIPLNKGSQVSSVSFDNSSLSKPFQLFHLAQKAFCIELFILLVASAEILLRAL
ncbi:MAG: hypothetical protein LBC61_01070 [Candidatus Peribacteria bacterium]|nr:hypothetical protein [Candidatus Peribacteria bacterium]